MTDRSTSVVEPPPSAEPTVSCRPKWVPPLAWQILILVAGVVTIIVGIILLPAPGPGSLIIYAGLGILATEFIWAKQLCLRIRDCALYVFNRARDWWQKK